MNAQPHRGRRRRLFQASAGAAALALVLVGCGSSKPSTSSSGSATAETASSSGGSSGGSSSTKSSYPPIASGPITLCASLALSGLTATQGTIATYNLAADWVNKNLGGIDGHPVKVMVKNDSEDATTAVNNIQDFVSLRQKDPNDCAAEIGMDYDPAIQPAMVAVTNKAHMPTILDSSVDAYVNATQYPYMFPINPSDAEVGTAMGKFMASKHWSKWAVLSDGIPQENEEIKDDEAGAKAAGMTPTIVKTATISPGATNVQTQLLELKQADPQVLLVMIGIGYGSVWEGLRNMGWSPNIVSDLAAFYFQYTDLGPLGKTAYAPAWWGSIPNHRALPANIESFMHEISKYEPKNYPGLLIAANVELDKVLLAAYAIEKYKSVDPDAMKAALESLHDTPIFWPGNQITESSTEHTGLVGPYSAGAMSMAALGPQSLFQYATPNGSPLAGANALSTLDVKTPAWPFTAKAAST